MVGFSSIFVVVHINKINTEHGYILQFTEKLQSMITFFFQFQYILFRTIKINNSI